TLSPDAHTLSLHDALPISRSSRCGACLEELVVSRDAALPRPLSDGELSDARAQRLKRRGHRKQRLQTRGPALRRLDATRWLRERSEEHTSELQSPCNLVCR